jgi:probable HAF family extracellular repeat protein
MLAASMTRNSAAYDGGKTVTTARRPLLLTTAVLAAAGRARDDAPSPDLAPIETTADVRAYVVRDLGTLGGAFGEATDINDRGQIVGGSRVSEESDDLHAFLWQNGVITDLGTLGGRNSWAYAINADEEIVGASERASGEERAVMWKGGRIIDLGRGRALGINDEELKMGPASGGDAVPQVWRFRKAAGLPTLGRLLRSSDEHAVLWRLE